MPVGHAMFGQNCLAKIRAIEGKLIISFPLYPTHLMPSSRALSPTQFISVVCMENVE